MWLELFGTVLFSVWRLLCWHQYELGMAPIPESTVTGVNEVYERFGLAAQDRAWVASTVVTVRAELGKAVKSSGQAPLSLEGLAQEFADLSQQRRGAESRGVVISTRCRKPRLQNQPFPEDLTAYLRRIFKEWKKLSERIDMSQPFLLAGGGWSAPRTVRRDVLHRRRIWLMETSSGSKPSQI